ncbi:MAG: MarR family transcriptional regulator, partial [Victivallaceae bacterium]|nr:MarR family transcriptional regulator [Victivallaceae bacterium]
MPTNKNIKNNDQIKRENRYAVLKLLYQRGAMSRSELTQTLNCDGTTITRISRFLIAEGFVKPLGFSPPSKKRGRPQELISLNENSCCSIGISFSPYELVGVLVDFSGSIVFQEQIHFEKNIKKDSFTVL